MKAELDQNRPNLGALQEYRTRQKVYLERQKEYNAKRRKAKRTKIITINSIDQRQYIRKLN